jgi:dGTPase
LQLFPEKYKKVYRHDHTRLQNQKKANEIDEARYRATEWNVRAHLIVDFLSGMTDDFAMTSYRMLSGMQV